MPGKSRHGKGKHYRYSKKAKALYRQGITAAPPETAPVANATSQATPAPTAPVIKAAAGAPLKTALYQYPFITSELRKIAILAGIIIVILVVLSLVLS